MTVGIIAAASNLTMGKSEINVPSLSQTAFPFMNFLKGVLQRKAQSTFQFQALQDANGYITGTIPAGSSNYVGGQLTLPSSYGAGLWRLGWTGTGFEQISGFGITITANSGATVNGTPGATGAFASGVIISGTNPQITFFFTAGTPSTNVTFNWTSGVFSGMSNEYLVRDTDWATFQTGGQKSYYTPEFLAFYRTLKPKTIRFMDWSFANNCNISRSSYLPPAGSATFAGPRWEPSAWAGATSNSGDTYSVAAPSGWGGLVDGATVQVQFNSANTTTTPTLNVASTGDKTIVNLQGTTITIGAMSLNQNATLCYSSVVGKWFYVSGGYTTPVGGGVSLDYQIALCNLVNANMWTCIPIMFDTASAAAQVSTIKAGINSKLSLYVEIANEVF